MAMSAELLKRKVEDLSSLPTLPAFVTVISSMVEDDSAGAQEIGDIIQRDQVLSARLLKLVNSPVYGFPRRISSVTHALVLLGFNVVKGLVLTTAVFNDLAKETSGLWKHSLGTAILSRHIGREVGVLDPEECMIAGLLHDLGKVILAHLALEDYLGAMAEAHRRGCHISVVEQEVFGVDHSRIALWLALRWHLPDRLTDALTYHHSPSRAKSSVQMASIIHVADILARALEYGEAGDGTMPELDHEAFDSLGLSLEQLDRIMIAADAQYQQGADVFATAGRGA
jgi:putative nucleotidyltransferase with HDIG domain